MKKTISFIFAVIGMFVFASVLMAAAFSDVPKDHWAFEAIDKLVQNGYMDGFADDTFRGRKVITRYELALTVAKILTKVEDVETAGGIISPKDAELIKSLATEFKEELKSLGVKLNALDQKVTEIEKKQKNYDKLMIAGYYKATEIFVWDRLTTHGDDDEGDYNGLGPFKNQVNLKITGRPFDNVEAYLELKSWVNSSSQDSKSYGKSVIRPYLVKYMTDYKRERDIRVEKNHLIVKSQYANVRSFTGESMTKLDDPALLMNSGGRNAMNKEDPTDVFSGIETQGTVKDVTYKGGVLKEWNNTSDIYNGRMVYMMPKRILKTDTAEVIFGATFVEKANAYANRGDFSEANGIDMSFKFTDIGTLKLTTEYMESRNGDRVLYGSSSNDIIRDDGVKVDAEYQLENLTLILNHYRYGKDFFVSTARYDSMYMDTQFNDDDKKHRNYKREDLLGERFLKLTLKYDMPFTEEQKLKLEGVIQNKKWEYNPRKTSVTDGYEGQKFSFQADADMAKDMTSKFYTELSKDALKDEIGTTYTEIEMNAKLNERISSTARFSAGNDSDDVNKESKTNKENKFYGELSSQLLKNIWGKVFGQRTIARIGWHDGNTENPSKDNTEVLEDITGFETNFTLSPSTTLKLTTKAQHNVYNAYTDQNEKFNWFTSELTEVFTDKLKGRVFYWWKNPQKHDMSSQDNLRNLAAELAYDATERTRMRVRYGDFIEDLDGNSTETEKKVSFEATTDF